MVRVSIGGTSAFSPSSSGGRKSGSLVLLTGVGGEGTGEMEEAGESGGLGEPGVAMIEGLNRLIFRCYKNVDLRFDPRISVTA